MYCSITVVIIFALMKSVWSHSNGAPEAACTALQPQHYGTTAEASPSPYTISISTTAISAGDTVTVRLNGGDFAGFLIVGEDQERNVHVGKFADAPANSLYQNGPCKEGFVGPAQYLASITHTNSSTKSDISVEWTSPDTYSGTVCFKGAVVETISVWWGGLTSTECVTVTALTTDAPTSAITNEPTTTTSYETTNATAENSSSPGDTSTTTPPESPITDQNASPTTITDRTTKKDVTDGDNLAVSVVANLNQVLAFTLAVCWLMGH